MTVRELSIPYGTRRFFCRFYHTSFSPVDVLTQCSLRSILILSSQMATKDTLFRNCELRLAGVHYLIYRSLRLKCIIADHHDSGSRVGLHPVSRGGITVIITCMDGLCWSFPSDVRSWSHCQDKQDISDVISLIAAGEVPIFNFRRRLTHKLFNDVYWTE